MRMNLVHVASSRLGLGETFFGSSFATFVIANFRILPVYSRAGGQGALCYTRAYIFRACATK